MTFWRKWVGLPWALGADPRDGVGACCFRTAQAIREELDMHWPEGWMNHWYQMARQGDWGKLRLDWEESTDRIEQPEAGALVRFDHRDGSFGTGALPNEKTIITVRHHGRLIAGPVSACGGLKLFRLK